MEKQSFEREIIYLMVRVDKLPPKKIMEAIDWGHLSFHLDVNPIPKLEYPKIQTLTNPLFGTQSWLVFHTKVTVGRKILAGPDTTPLQIAPQAIEAVINPPGTTPEKFINAKSFFERASLIFRFSESWQYLPSQLSLPLVEARVYFYANFFLTLDENLITQRFGLYLLATGRGSWCVVLNEKSPAQKFFEERDLSEFGKEGGKDGETQE